MLKLLGMEEIKFFVTVVGEDGRDPESEGDTERAVTVVAVECEASDGRRLREHEPFFLKFIRDLGSALRNDEWAYMSVSGPLRTLEKPYCRYIKSNCEQTEFKWIFNLAEKMPMDTGDLQD